MIVQPFSSCEFEQDRSYEYVWIPCEYVKNQVKLFIGNWLQGIW